MKAKNTAKSKGVPDSSLDFARLPFIRGTVKKKNASAWVLFDGELAGVYPKWKKLKKQLDRNPSYKGFRNIMHAIDAYNNPHEHLKSPAKPTPLF